MPCLLAAYFLPFVTSGNNKFINVWCHNNYRDGAAVKLDVQCNSITGMMYWDLFITDWWNTGQLQSPKTQLLRNLNTITNNHKTFLMTKAACRDWHIFQSHWLDATIDQLLNMKNTKLSLTSRQSSSWSWSINTHETVAMQQTQCHAMALTTTRYVQKTVEVIDCTMSER